MSGTVINQRLHIVNFGSSKGGLGTIGFTVYDPSGSTSSARSTTGVVEFGTATGIYGAVISLEENFDGVVLWDTGDATIRYAAEPSEGQLNRIQDNTDKIRMIYNTIRNQYDASAKVLELLRDQEKPKDYTKNINNLETLMKGMEGVMLPGTKKIDSIKQLIEELRKKPILETEQLKEIERIVSSKSSQMIADIDKKVVSIQRLLTSMPKVNAEEMRLAAKTEVEGFRKTVVGLADKNGISEIKNLIGGILNDLNTMKKDIASTEKNLQNAIIENTKLDKVVKDMMLASQAIKSIESFHTQSGDLNKLRLSLGLKAR